MSPERPPESGGDATRWRLKHLEEEVQRLATLVDLRVTKEAFRERRTEIEQALTRVEDSVGELRRSVEELEDSMSREQVRKLEESLADQASRIRQESEQRSSRTRWAVMTLISVLALMTSVGALLWNILQRILLP